MNAPVPASAQRLAIGADIPNMLRRHARIYRIAKIPPAQFRIDAIGELIIAAAIIAGDETNLDMMREASITALVVKDQKNWTFEDLARDAGRSEGGILLP